MKRLVAEIINFFKYLNSSIENHNPYIDVRASNRGFDKYSYN